MRSIQWYFNLLIVCIVLCFSESFTEEVVLQQGKGNYSGCTDGYIYSLRADAVMGGSNSDSLILHSEC